MRSKKLNYGLTINHSLTIKTNLCGASDFTTIDRLLAPIPINAGPGYDIIYEPVNYSWKYIPNGYYQYFDFWICDQNGDDISFIGTPRIQIEVTIQKRPQPEFNNFNMQQSRRP